MDEIVREHLSDLMLGEIVNKKGLVYAGNLEPRLLFGAKSGVQVVEFERRRENASYLVKDWRDYRSISGILLSKMQKAAGLYTPEVAPSVFKKGSVNNMRTIQRYLDSDGMVDVDMEYNSVFMRDEGVWELDYLIESEIMNTKRVEGYDDKWDVLRNARYREIFESAMTKDAFDAKILSALVREVSGDVDGVAYNNLTCALDDGIVQAIVPIDFENSEVFCNVPQILRSKSFVDFAKKHRYDTATPLNRVDKKLTYEERLLNVRKLINEGYLTEAQVAGLRQAVDFDLARGWGDLCKNKELTGFRDGKDVMSMLQDYNRENLPELGL